MILGDFTKNLRIGVKFTFNYCKNRVNNRIFIFFEEKALEKPCNRTGFLL